ncbi:MAG TPA: hypothetical protein VNH18_36245 [Bryobacteraceae bacterium]|nr:hypothetical protein [Bryobacteraceae bacterium]
MVIKETYYGILRSVVGGLLTICFSTSAWYSFKAADADHAYRENTLPSVRKAVSLAPGNAVYVSLLAEMLEGENQDPNPQLTETTRLTPLDSQYWIRRAFRAEVEGDFPRTERFLLQAARVDHKGNPRWALMNFYFRRGQSKEFWYWVTRALEVSSDDVTSIFRLAWDQSQDSKLILSHIPNRDDLMIQYFGFLSGTGRLDDASDVALRVARLAPMPAIPMLLGYCDRYAEGDSRRALMVWNALCEKKAIPFRPLDPSAGQIVTNADYAIEPTQHGFDWSAPALDGVAIGQNDEGGMRIELSGNQPEDCVVLQQVMPLISGKTYELTWKSGAASGTPVAGLFWEVSEGGAASSSSTAPISGEAASNMGKLSFVATEQSSQLRLRYTRPIGSVRAAGVVVIKGLSGQAVR